MEIARAATGFLEILTYFIIFAVSHQGTSATRISQRAKNASHRFASSWRDLMFGRIFRSSLAGLGGNLLALFVIIAVQLVWARVELASQSTGLGAVAGGLAELSVLISIVAGFLAAFYWTWRKGSPPKSHQ